MISSIRSCVTFFLSSVDSVWVDGYALTVKGLCSKRGKSSLVMRKALKLNKPHGELLYRLKSLVSFISAQRPRHAQKMCTLVSSPANIQELFFISTRCCLQCSRMLGPNMFFWFPKFLSGRFKNNIKHPFPVRNSGPKHPCHGVLVVAGRMHGAATWKSAGSRWPKNSAKKSLDVCQFLNKTANLSATH